MPAKNGHDDAAPDVGFGGPLALGEATDAAGGVWIGSNILRAHLAHIEQQRQIQAAMLRAEACWQIEVQCYRDKADQAQADLARCLKEGDHAGAAAAARALSIACSHLIRLGVE